MSEGDPAGDVVVEKEMALKRADLLRGLPAALGTDGFRVDGDTAILTDGRKRFEIVMGDERTRRIALLEVPAMTVRLRLAGYAPGEAKEALARSSAAGASAGNGGRMGDFIAILGEYLARNRSRAKNFYLLKASIVPRRRNPTRIKAGGNFNFNCRRVLCVF